MRHFKNELETDISLSYSYSGESVTKTVAPQADFTFPDDFAGPVSVGISEKVSDVVIANGGANGNATSNP